MIDINTEELIPLGNAAQRVPGRLGKPGVHVSTMTRWCHEGINDERLEFVKVGGRILTSMAAVERFITRVTAAGRGSPTPPSPVPKKKLLRKVQQG